MKINIKKLLISIGIPLLLGGIVGFLSGSFKGYDNITMPSFAPPGYLFPIVWSILYILMGISSYIIKEKGGYQSIEALKNYRLQLVVNLLWSFFFFSFRWYLFSFLWIVLLIILVIKMIISFKEISKLSAYLQIPYLLWIIFAAVLNFSIYLLN